MLRAHPNPLEQRRMSMADVWQTTPALPAIPLGEGLRQAARRGGRSPGQQLKEIVGLALAPGRLQPEDYFYYRLFESRYDAAAQQRFVGKRLEPRLHRLTCDADWAIVAHDKLVCHGLLQSLGFPMPTNRALYRETPGFALPGALLALADRAALASALRSGIAGPLFGKPVRGIRSVGVLSIDGYDAASDRLRLAHGQSVSVDETVQALAAYGRDGYLLQARIAQHPAVTAICGDAVATVRVVVLLTGAGPVIHRALWKLPAGTNVADNFWRPGNLLAAVDAETGRITRAVQGVGPEAREVDRHPTSDAPLVGDQLPDWPQLVALVRQAATALPGVRMQAWDVALGATGPLLVEVNIGGDYNLPQLATGSGTLDDRFIAFLAECAKARGRERDFAKLKLTRLAARGDGAA
jgi:hypothetical protein